MANGPFTWFDAALDKIAKNVIRLDTGTFKAVLVTEVQAIGPTFVGGSGDCRYADLTNELATANGYTAGGLTLAGVTFSRTAGVVKFTANPIDWTLTNTISYKYLIILQDNTNDDLLCFLDANTASGSALATPTAGSLIVTPHANGIVGWNRV